MKLTYLFISILMCNVAFSQEPRVITFDSEQEKNSNNNSEKNIIKISLFEIISGDFPLYYERVLSDKFSLEGSVGITFGDYIGGLFLDDFSSIDNSSNSNYGFSFSASLRFYPIEILEEFYIAPEFKYRKYNWEREYSDMSGISNLYAENRTYAMPRINLGYSFFYDNQLIFDYYVGIGMNNITENRYDYETNNISESKLRRPRVHIGLKIGYVF